MPKKTRPVRKAKAQKAIKLVELYLNECYSCHAKKYAKLYAWYIEQQLPLSNFKTKRAVLDPKWLEEAKSIGIEMPFIKLTFDDGTTSYTAYDEFIEINTKGGRHARTD